jgi:hypothetical protein
VTTSNVELLAQAFAGWGKDNSANTRDVLDPDCELVVPDSVPWAIANAAYKKQKRNEAVTEIVQVPNRGHSLTIDSGWREVANTALAFVKRFV